MSEVRKLRRSLTIWTLVGLAVAVIGLIVATAAGGAVIGVVLVILGLVVGGAAFAMRLRLEHSAGKAGR